MYTFVAIYAKMLATIKLTINQIDLFAFKSPIQKYRNIFFSQSVN